MIKNLTPHAVVICGQTFPPSGELARVAVTLAPAKTASHWHEADGVEIPLVSGTYGQVTGLPGPEDDVLYIVSALVRCACPDRKDLGSPAKLVRDAAGNIVGCEALEVNP
jgi:hypothetical protein